MEDAAIENWHRLIRTYDCVPLSRDFMRDSKRVNRQIMPFDEQVASGKSRSNFGAGLEIKSIRALCSVSPDAPCGGEGHQDPGRRASPLYFAHPWIIRHVETYKKGGCDALGFLPDRGMFLRAFPPAQRGGARMAVPVPVADSIVKS
ncbi:hypothetical protein [uncultured Croceicoccus sp.]|uniref:hypothetical protein n=1 Tax=uncultured Croceicoccus sp. TaxID=1295329 RepID=UPI002610C7BA|nr:hypothetical protein [uncultured Croceicoccus sp.]